MNKYELGRKSVETFVIPSGAQTVTCIDNSTGFEYLFCACYRNGVPDYIDMNSLRKAYKPLPMKTIIDELKDIPFTVMTQIVTEDGVTVTKYILTK